MKNLSHWTRLSPLFFNPFPYTGPALVLSARPLRRAVRRVPAINLRPDQQQDVPAIKSNPNQQTKCGAKQAAKARFDHLRR